MTCKLITLLHTSSQQIVFILIQKVFTRTNTLIITISLQNFLNLLLTCFPCLMWGFLKAIYSKIHCLRPIFKFNQFCRNVIWIQKIFFYKLMLFSNLVMSFFTLPNSFSSWLCVNSRLLDNSSISIAILSRHFVCGLQI